MATQRPRGVVSAGCCPGEGLDRQRPDGDDRQGEYSADDPGPAWTAAGESVPTRHGEEGYADGGAADAVLEDRENVERVAEQDRGEQQV
jgi:hypothetical protein